VGCHEVRRARLLVPGDIGRRVVDQDVQAAVGPRELGCGGLDARAFADVEADFERADVAGVGVAQLLGGGGCPGRLAGGHHDRRAGECELACHLASQAARGAGDRILDTAERLFYRRGVHRVGMDELVREAGLGKATVYRLYPTKDVLIGAYLQRLSDRILALIAADIAAHEDDPAAAIRAIFLAIARDLSRADFRGCAFNNASIEFEVPKHPARVVSREYRAALRDRLRDLARQLRPGGAGDELGDQLALLVDGMYLSAAHLGAGGPAASALPMVDRLLPAPRR
jgi:AcrR family transcriptional regulator